MLGVISSRRDCWASRRVGSGRSSKCYNYRLESYVQRSSKFDMTYSCCLEDFAKAGEIVDARVEGSDGIVEKLQRRLQ